MTDNSGPIHSTQTDTDNTGFIITLVGLIAAFGAAYAIMGWTSLHDTRSEVTQMADGENKSSIAKVEEQSDPDPMTPTEPELKASEEQPDKSNETPTLSVTSPDVASHDERVPANLIPTLNLRRDVIKGKWIEEAGVLRSESGGGSLVLPVEVPKHFELSLRLKRLYGRRGFSIGIVRNDISVLLVLDHYEGSGFELIDGKRRGDNSSFIKQKQLEIGQEADVKLRVDGQSLVCVVNEKRIIDWKGEYRRLSKSGNQDVWGAPYGKLCLYVSDSDVQISSINLRPIDPQR